MFHGAATGHVFAYSGGLHVYYTSATSTQSNPDMKACAICEHILQVRTEARRIWTIWYSGSAIWIKLLKNGLTELQNWGEKISNWVLEKQKMHFLKKAKTWEGQKSLFGERQAGSTLHSAKGLGVNMENVCQGRSQTQEGGETHETDWCEAVRWSEQPQKSVPGNATRWDQELKMGGK